jgi:hypothetical protein
MKSFRKNVEPALKAQVKSKTLKNYSMSQTGDHTGLIIMEFANKANMNKFLKTMAAVRNEQAAAQNAQFWAYNGPVKASG